MALYKPEKHKISDILDWYIEMNIPSFDITQKKVHGKGYYHGNSIEEGLEKLEKLLITLKGDDNQNDYVLQLVNNTKGKTKPSEIMYCLTFDFAGEFSHNQIGSMPVYNNGLSHSDIKAIAEEIRRQDVENIEEEIEDLEPQPQNLLAGILNNPEIQQALAVGIASVVGRIPDVIGGIFNKKPSVTSLAGVSDNKNLDEVIQILFIPLAVVH